MNSKFVCSPKLVYRDFKGSCVTLNEVPTTNEVEEFWKNIWEKETKIVIVKAIERTKKTSQRCNTKKLQDISTN